MLGSAKEEGVVRVGRCGERIGRGGWGGGVATASEDAVGGVVPNMTSQIGR